MSRETFYRSRVSSDSCCSSRLDASRLKEDGAIGYAGLLIPFVSSTENLSRSTLEMVTPPLNDTSDLADKIPTPNQKCLIDNPSHSSPRSVLHPFSS